MKIFLLIAMLSFMIGANAQSITETPEWSNLIKALDNEQWADADKLSLELLKKAPDNGPNDPMVAVLRYMYIHAEAGLMNDGKLTQDQALKDVIAFKDKMVVLPGHPIAVKHAFNSIQMVNEKTDSLYIAATNSNATSIFSFEYIILKDKWPVEDFKSREGKVFILGGHIQSITVEGNILPRFRIIIDQAVYRPFE